MALATLGVWARAAAEDLPHDERVIVGKLANGATWMYRQHDNPPGKMALMVHVGTGSLNETDAQRGLAHFLEHMAFNGSEHFPPGALIPYFESIGMEFGADLNAFTSFEQTSYMIFLPSTDVEQVDKALMVLSDQVFRALLLPEEIDKERGVILAEKRAGMSAQQRIRDKLWPELYAGSRFGERMPIGVEEVISGAPPAEFVSYYRTWYRPERVTLMMVGDAPHTPYLASIEKWFGQYRPEAPALADRGAQFRLFAGPRAIVVTDPEYAQCQVALYNIEPGRPPTTTVEQARTELVEELGSWIVGRRFRERVQQGVASYHSAGVSISDFFNEALQASGTARGEPDKWEAMLEELITEIGRARDHGFTQREFELAKAEMVAEAERAVRTESTRNARALLMQMNRCVNEREPLLSARQELELIQRLLPTIELAEVSEAFARHFAPQTFAYVLTMPEKEGVSVPAREQVLAAARAALARKMPPPQEEQRATEVLAALPEPGRVVESAMDEELGITSCWLANGARVHHRFMDYKKDQVTVTISLAGGQIEETADNAHITEVAALAFGQAATRRLSSNEIADIMTGKNIRVSAAVGDDTLVVRVSGSPKDLEIGLQLAHALLMEGRIEESAFTRWKETSLQRYEAGMKMPGFVAQKTLQEVISGDDPRLTVKTPEQISAQSLPAAQAWLERICRQAPIEVAAVGDIGAEQVLPLIERYVGSLPPRPRAAPVLDALRLVKRGRGPFERHVSVETVTPQAVVLCGFVGSHIRDVRDTRALELASKTLDSRLIKRVREELGLVYSLHVRSAPAEAYEDTGVVVTGAPCAPDNPEQVLAEIEAIFTAYATDGPSPEELENAKKQVLENLDTDMKEPGFWLEKLQHAELHKLDLNELKREKEAYQAFTADELRDVFCRYYTPERRFQIVVVPTAPGGGATGAEKRQEAVPAVP